MLKDDEFAFPFVDCRFMRGEIRVFDVHAGPLKNPVAVRIAKVAATTSVTDSNSFTHRRAGLT